MKPDDKIRLQHMLDAPQEDYELVENTVKLDLPVLIDQLIKLIDNY